MSGKIIKKQKRHYLKYFIYTIICYTVSLTDFFLYLKSELDRKNILRIFQES